jgi:hypothetical protein
VLGGVSVYAVLRHSACVRASRRVSASAPTSSACSCGRNSRVWRSSPSNREHDLGADAGHRSEGDHLVTSPPAS